MRILVDAMGGDLAPDEIVKGAVHAQRELGAEIVLVGQRAAIETCLRNEQAELEIIDASEVITMDDDPSTATRRKKDASMTVALNLLRDGKGDAVVSAGSTGALIMGGTFFVKRIRGVSRAALAAIAPTDKGPFMLIDSGANVECRPDMLLQFAHMGSLYMTAVMNQGRPATVGLLNVGTEDHKGGELQHEAFALLKESGLHFVGNVEARDVPLGVVDVLVADGFSGNVLLKTMEGTADMLMLNLKRVFFSSLKTKLGALLVKGGIGKLKEKVSTASYGGAPLLGLTKPVIKTHGNAKAEAVKHAIRVAAQFAGEGVIEKITAAVKKDETKA